MSYPTDTILARREAQGTKYDRVQVVGPSPIHTSAPGEWGGSPSGEALIVLPIGTGEFAGPEVMPVRVAHEDYTVEYEPDLPMTHVESVQATRQVRRLTAEEQFRATAQVEAAPKTTRTRTKIGA